MNPVIATSAAFAGSLLLMMAYACLLWARLRRASRRRPKTVDAEVKNLTSLRTPLRTP